MLHLSQFWFFKPNFDQIIFGTLISPGTMWYVVTAWGPQMVRHQKKFGNYCLNLCHSKTTRFK